MEKNNNIVQGDYFFINGRLIKDDGLSFIAKDVFEALASLQNGVNWSVRNLVDEKGFSRKKANTGVMELVSAGLVSYDAIKDEIKLL